jgi:hypothetical protein
VFLLFLLNISTLAGARLPDIGSPIMKNAQKVKSINLFRMQIGHGPVQKIGKIKAELVVVKPRNFYFFTCHLRLL